MRCARPLKDMRCSPRGWPGWCSGNIGGSRNPVGRALRDSVPSLTERETEILRHVAKGLTAKQIAARLSLSHRTVENHVQATFRKLQVANRVDWRATRSNKTWTRNSRVVLLIRFRLRARRSAMKEPPHRAVISRLSADFAAISRQLARVSADLTALDRLLSEQPPAPQPVAP